MVSVDQRLAALAEMPSAQLRAAWVKLTSTPVPRLSPAMLRMALAWEIRTKAYGGMPRGFTTALDQLARGTSVTRTPAAGMRLVREWNGCVHVVMVGEDQVIRWNEREWRNLSQVEPDACIRASLAAAKRVGFDPHRLMFEFTENERMQDVAHVQHIIDAYRARGFATAIDDFGAGYAGLNLLANLRPDMLKLDMALIRGIDGSTSRQVIVAGVARIAEALGVRCIAEGIETVAELRALRDLGISLCQGYLLARPVVETLPSFVIPAV